LYSSFDFVYLFDHSQGHARRRDGALNALNISRNFGRAGAQQQMRDTFIASKEGYLGAHLPSLSVGDTQSMVFKSDNNGPWYLSPEEREVQRHDRVTREKQDCREEDKEDTPPRAQ
jgi:adenosylmethionine-8-amino-7-oxononanoate aminotransferase